MPDINDEVIKRLDRQDETLRELTRSINEFAQIVARKEVSDQHFDKQLNEVRDSVSDLTKRTGELEKIAAGDAAYGKIRDYIWRATIGVVVTLSAGGVIWAITQSGVTG